MQAKGEKEKVGDEEMEWAGRERKKDDS